MGEVGFLNPVLQDDLRTIADAKSVDWERFRGKTVLITGGYGMLASYIVYLLCYLNINRGIDLRVLVTGRSEAKAKSRFEGLIDGELLTFIKMSAEDSFEESFPRADYIIHAASPASGQYYDTNPVDVFITNAIGAKKTLDYALRSKAERYLLVSSGEVYGMVNDPLFQEGKFGSLDPMNVRSCYGEGKRAAECMLACYGRQYGISGSSVRPSHTYGPTMDIVNDQRVFANFVANIIKNQDIVLKSDGKALRSFCYIAEATLAYIKVLLDGKPGMAYNVACANGTISIKELAEALAEIYGVKVVYAPREGSYLENRFTLQPQMDVSRLAELGVVCRMAPIDGFKRTIEAFAQSKLANCQRCPIDYF